MPVYYISIELSKKIQRCQTPPALLTLPLLMIEWENLQFQQLVANCPLVGYFGGAPVLRSVGYCVVSHHFLLHFANNKQVCGYRLLCPTRLCCGIQQDSTFCCNYCLWLFLFFFPCGFFCSLAALFLCGYAERSKNYPGMMTTIFPGFPQESFVKYLLWI